MNERLNEKFEWVQEQFDTESRAQKESLDVELNQIYQAKSSLMAQESERRSRAKRQVHGKTMEDGPVRNYILEALGSRV